MKSGEHKTGRKEKVKINFQHMWTSQKPNTT